MKQLGVPVMNYAYNGAGERVRRYTGLTETYTVFDESGHWLGDYGPGGAAVQQAIWLIGRGSQADAAISEAKSR